MGLSFHEETFISEASETLHFRIDHPTSETPGGIINQETRSDDIGIPLSNVDIQIVEENQ